MNSDNIWASTPAWPAIRVDTTNASTMVDSSAEPTGSGSSRRSSAGAVTSVGSTGDSYDNALAEAFNSLFKAELVRNRGPWKSIDDLEIAVAECVDWFNHRRPHGEIGLFPPAEHEDNHYRHNTPTTIDASVASLHCTRGETVTFSQPGWCLMSLVGSMPKSAA